ncbi:uncharacterized protein HRG_08702 [Hirsutella rhossiliensis]|uniref:DUF7137 domain-containing protein n=1 Tax=Hirsutella rhossiliensis TaxID=111463 RepID=A0A9P8MT18_9HYPO|nr:uncharacterized protein HRG_08702 [Hirsutella rhossiliensis]KAH0960547.1 hypothetical protein HRG_08702 [Hirsutella rhossiliensis]
MRPAQSLVSLAVCLSSIVVPAAAVAWPNSHWLPEIRNLVARQDSSSSSRSASPSPSATPGSAVSADSTASRTNAGQNTAEPTATGKSSGKSSGTRTKDGGSEATHTEFPPDAPPGGVSMLSPATNLEPTPLYKIRDHVTWSWNYTSLLGTPTAVDVLVSCSVASETWTLTSNMTFETSVEYVWDTNKEADSVEKPLLEQLYTLIVKDSEAAITAPPQPGYLGTYKGFTFGLYAGKPATAFADWKCTGCSGASSLFDNQALGLAVSMSVITFLSFTWFVSGLGLR